MKELLGILSLIGYNVILYKALGVSIKEIITIDIILMFIFGGIYLLGG